MSEGRKELEQTECASGPPRVFVSYTHENPEHKRWVSQLAYDLRSNGVDTVLDQWDLQLGDDVTLFMEHGIRDADRVLLVCTPTYARKANEGQGGVGYERLVVTGELAARIDTNKFICVLRAGTKEESIPAFAQTRLFVDFTSDATYKVSLEDLLRDIHNAPLAGKPPVGENPFKSAPQPVVTSTVLKIGQTRVDASQDPEEIYARATRLLRDKDLLGWKQLLRNVRSVLPQRIGKWRSETEDVIRGRTIKREEWFEMLHSACREASPLMILALTAVDSEIEGLSDQRGLLDDLLAIPGWQPSGTKIVIEAPAVLAYVFHNVLGAFLLLSRRNREAIRLLRTNVPVGIGSSHVQELWHSSDMMGWDDAFSNDLMAAWGFVDSLWETYPWLGHFFVRSHDFSVGILRIYASCGSAGVGKFLRTTRLSRPLRRECIFQCLPSSSHR